MLLTSSYIPCVPSSEEERKQSSHEQRSQTMHTSLVHVEKIGTHQLRWEEGENGNIRKRNTTHASQCARRCGDALLTGCYVPRVPNREEERKQSSHEQGSQTKHTSLVHVEKSGTHRLRWEEGEKGNIRNTTTNTCNTMC